MKQLLIKFLLLVTLFIGVNSFDGTGKNVDVLLTQRITPVTGSTYNLIAIKQDVLVVIDLAATIAQLNVPFPATPADTQLIGFTTRSAITSLNFLVTGGIPITAPVTTLAAGAVVWYIYNADSNRWFRY